MTAPEPALADFLREAGLAEPDEEGEWTPLSGGVSSDIWRVDLARGPVCVKRALAQLKVAADWRAPVDRNAHEWEFTRLAAAIAPGGVPRPLAHDPARGLFAMAWLPPADHPPWKTELLAGRVALDFAGRVGRLVGTIHAATARDPTVPARFATDATFAALRIEPYLRTTAGVHPDLAPALNAVADRTAGTRRVLVHGDVSPKNILAGLHGPVLLDAECAWFGDPAFDLAFCLNHLAIKARIVAGARDKLIAAYDRLAAAYLAMVDWETPGELEARAATLLAALALARVDGKSPVEYLDEPARAALRQSARRAVSAAPATLADALGLLLA